MYGATKRATYAWEKLLNNGDWFTLEEEYPMIKDSVQTPMLRLMSEALLGYYFNRPDETITCVDSLLQHYQAELGLGNIASMLLVKSIVEANRGNYAVAADILKRFYIAAKGTRCGNGLHSNR